MVKDNAIGVMTAPSDGVCGRMLVSGSVSETAPLLAVGGGTSDDGVDAGILTTGGASITEL